MSKAKKTTRKIAKKGVKKTANKAAKKTTKKTASKKKLPKKAAAKKKTANKPSSKKAAKKTPAKKATAKKAPAKKVRKKSSHPKAFIKKQNQKLLDLRDSLVDAMYGVTHDTLKNTNSTESGGGGIHLGDAGSDSYDRDFALSLLSKERDALQEIEHAIERIEKGLYGICEMSQDLIPKERLEAIPFARYTVTCQAQWEKQSRIHKIHGTSEFGFSNGKGR